MSRRSHPVWLVALIFSLGCSPHPGGETGEAVRDVGVPGESCDELTSDGAWCWFADPRAVSYEGQRTQTYVGWVDKGGRVRVASVDHDDGEIRSATVASFARPDDHANPALLVRPDGRLAAFYSEHGGNDIFCRVTVRPEDIAAWGEPTALRPGDGKGGYGFTYPTPFALDAEQGRTYLFYRGRHRRPSYITTDDFESWTDERTLLRDEVGDSYVKYVSDGASSVHLAFTDGHPRGRPVNSIYYARYEDGAFLRADGGLVCEADELPFTPSEADVVYNATEAGARAWVWDIALDREGHPVVVYAVFPRESEHRYGYALWDGVSWSNSEIVFSGGWFPETPEGQEEGETYYSGGVVLDHGDPSVVYLSRRVRGVHEIERWETDDGGRTWRSDAVTSGSAAGNVRPVVPRPRVPGGPEVLWMSGSYATYTDYATSIRMRR